MKNSLFDRLEDTFVAFANSERAVAMSAYMKNNFIFYGIPAPERKLIFEKEFKHLEIRSADELHEILLNLWEKPEREWQYAAMHLAVKFKKHWNLESIYVFENMLLNASWWDTVDTLSSHCIGPYFLKFPTLKDKVLNAWENGRNMWLKRVCIIHQLTYKLKTDTDYLAKIIFMNQESKEFFIQKAIGWALRQYAKINPAWVVSFVECNDLKPLSKREALKNIKL